MSNTWHGAASGHPQGYGQPPADPAAYASGPPYGGYAYPPPPVVYGYAPPQNSGPAVAVLVLGISSFVLFWAACGVGIIPAIIALAMAPSAKREIVHSGGAIGGLGMVQAGAVLSWITVGFTVAALLVLAAIFLPLILAGASAGA